MSKLDAILPDSPEAALSRRSLVQTIGGTALAMTFLAGCGGSNDNNNNGGSGSTGGSTARDADILNFALNLEYLEAEFYNFATRGQGLAAGDTSAGSNNNGLSGNGALNNSGPTTGGAAVNFTSQYGRQIAEEITADETTHVKLLRSFLPTIGYGFIAKPAINLNPFGLDMTDENVFINYARAFEDVGVTAYGGAAPFLNSSAILGTAAGILATEALHTGNLRLQAVLRGASGSPNGQPLDSKDALPSQPDPVSGGPNNFFATDASALAFKRTPREVLRIVLNQPGATTPTNAGGFFPNGVNGNLTRLLALG